MLHHRLLRTALAVAIAGSALSLGSLPAQAASFTDIGPSKFRQDIEWLAGAGITSGCGEGRFCPKGAVTRGQMASFLSRFLELPQPEKRDAYTDDDGSGPVAEFCPGPVRDEVTAMMEPRMTAHWRHADRKAPSADQHGGWPGPR
ncbi:MAG: S-layer homology domain-containing protein [Candidatus Limnocylindria bacterium]